LEDSFLRHSRRSHRSLEASRMQSTKKHKEANSEKKPIGPKKAKKPKKTTKTKTPSETTAEFEENLFPLP
jgi:hypothetical protein